MRGVIARVLAEEAARPLAPVAPDVKRAMQARIDALAAPLWAALARPGLTDLALGDTRVLAVAYRTMVDLNDLQDEVQRWARW
jgi:hypothetical protein